MSTVVGARDTQTGKIVWHAAAEMPGAYQTLCCVSLIDDLFESVEPARGQKIKCIFCWQAWTEAKRFRKTDFDL